ncbi:MAG: two-component sensor histidine kinase [Desulfobacteraceae bacterium 4484_190.3]|nr:MAG: two-component sensor histidine kinase [Desulfobacteraceae bacterium 4484_190.3]
MDLIKTSYYKSLSRNFVLTIIIVSFTPMILVSGFILNQFQISYREKIFAHLEELVLKHRQNIDSFLKEKLSDIRFVGENFSFEDLSDRSFLQDKLSSLQQEYGSVYEDLGVVNEKGVQTAYVGPFKLEKALYYEADWFKKAKENRYFISDVFSGLRGRPHFIVAVRNIHEGRLWILRSTIDFVTFNSLVENLRIGKTGFAYILNRKGEFQTRSRFDDIVPDKELYLDFLEQGPEAGDKVFIVEKPDSFGEKNIYVTSFLKNGDWMLVYQQDSADAFSDLRHTRRIALIIFIIGGLGIIIMALLLSRKLITRIAKADREKEMLNKQVIETGKLASVGELAAGIAHEINNPVAIMVEEAGWIKDLLEEEEFQEGENLEEFQRALQQIKTQGLRCKEITHKLLSFARKTDSRIQEVQINDLIEEMIGLSAQKSKYSNIIINTNLEKDLPIIHVSQSELQQVFLNLFNNAIDAVNAIGKNDGTITVTSKVEDNYIIVDVADNGPGIPKANLARIFDPFFTTKPVGRGTGLGLSICYGIIEKMGGKLAVSSVVDMGTTFSVKIPLDKDKENS